MQQVSEGEALRASCFPPTLHSLPPVCPVPSVMPPPWARGLQDGLWNVSIAAPRDGFPYCNNSCFPWSQKWLICCPKYDKESFPGAPSGAVSHHGDATGRCTSSCICFISSPSSASPAPQPPPRWPHRVLRCIFHSLPNFLDHRSPATHSLFPWRSPRENASPSWTQRVFTRVYYKTSSDLGVKDAHMYVHVHLSSHPHTHTHTHTHTRRCVTKAHGKNRTCTLTSLLGSEAGQGSLPRLLLPIPAPPPPRHHIIWFCFYHSLHFLYHFTKLAYTPERWIALFFRLARVCIELALVFPESSAICLCHAAVMV